MYFYILVMQKKYYKIKVIIKNFGKKGKRVFLTYLQRLINLLKYIISSIYLFKTDAALKMSIVSLSPKQPHVRAYGYNVNAYSNY